MSGIDQIEAAFELLTDWEDRYRHLIELGRTLAPLSPEEHSAATKVKGCVSQVWLVTERGEGADPILAFRGDSDAHIVRGLIAVLVALYSGLHARQVLAVDARAVLSRLGLDAHLSPQRSNGLYAMVDRIRAEAARAVSQ